MCFHLAERLCLIPPPAAISSVSDSEGASKGGQDGSQRDIERERERYTQTRERGRERQRESEGETRSHRSVLGGATEYSHRNKKK